MAAVAAAMALAKAGFRRHCGYQLSVGSFQLNP